MSDDLSPSRSASLAPSADLPDRADTRGIAWDRVTYPLPWRTHQNRALDAIAGSWQAGSRRAWVVLPPGAGKTLVGLEAARRAGRPTVIFSPNTAIQGQWIDEWRRFEPAIIPIGDDRGLATPVTSLTYQSLATFDPDDETDDDGRTTNRTSSSVGLLDRLHAGGAELVQQLSAAGPITLVLDECHHLLEVWGRLIAELLEELPDALVIGLTATPPDSLTTAEAELVDDLFGSPLYSTSIPALVRDGYLAPFAELAWLVRPTPTESDWLRRQSERFAELQTDLTDPALARIGFLDWLDRRFVNRAVEGPADPDGDQLQALQLDWFRIEHDDPDLAAAALRFCTAGLLNRPPGSVLREEHQHRPTADDWVVLIKDYVDGCLLPSTDDRDQDLVQRIRKALPGVGYQLTRRGIRRSRSPVDRVIARSAAKTTATVEILAAEADDLGDQLRALALCDHERATATTAVGLRGVLDQQAGSARLLLATLINDERTAVLSPMLITGRTVAGASDTITAFARYATAQDPTLALRQELADDHDFVELQGNWSSRKWVGLATRFFESGGTRALIGTRALLGEGWDARRVNVLVDLTTATTPTAVVQTRGRALRLDPEDPEKVAHTWSVVCVSEDHPGGFGDWDRFVRKHAGYLAVTDSGEIAVGVGHVDPDYSPYSPPAVARFDAGNAAMLVRAEDRTKVRDLWQIGTPYHDQLLRTVRITGSSGPTIPAVPNESDEPPALLPGTGPTRHRLHGPLAPIIGSVVAFIIIAAMLLGGASWGLLLALPVLIGWGWWLHRRRVNSLHAGRDLQALSTAPDLISYARAVADAMADAGLCRAGATAVTARVDSGGGYQVTLSGVTPEASATFGTAFAELIGPIENPRYLVPRFQADPIADEDEPLRRAGRRWLSGAPLDRAGVTYHAVPTLFGANADQLEHLMVGWHRWVSAGDPVRTATPEGTGLLISARGSTPVDATAVLRETWE